MALGRTLFQLGYEISPIILVGGVAAAIPGQMLPIVAITESLNFVGGLLQGNVDINLDQYFAHFKVLPGATLINNQIGEYPFANQTIAANAIIKMPNHVSIKMSCPAKGLGGYVTKALTMTALKQILDAHNFSGGLYIVASPSFTWINCVMLRMHDITSGDTKQVQTEWVLDFEQPLISLADADIVYNALMSKIAGALPQTGEPTWSGLATSVGSSIAGAASGITSSVKSLVGGL